MSGTSLDALDIAYVTFDFTSSPTVEFKLIQAESIPYPATLERQLRDATSLASPDLFELHHQLGIYYAQQVEAFIEKHRLPKQEIDAIASHGQTIFHQPERGFTVQIGCGATLAYTCQLPVISDFRSLDVIAGGQGAPLVPIGDLQLFHNKADAFLNLGGFANISFQQQSKVVAYDLCAANLPMNLWMQAIGKNYDKDGELAQQGQVNEVVLAQLNQLDYYQQSGPKSLGSEWLSQNYLPHFESLNLADKLATHIAHCAHQIACQVPKSCQKILVTGGGAKNPLLIKALQHACKAELLIPDEQLIDFKEALIFAFLGARHLRGESTTIESVTGASKALCTGVLHQHF
ncbi:MAG: Anhydro-N-acetylmuramic acid kinase [Bacteroidota bacterium]